MLEVQNSYAMYTCQGNVDGEQLVLSHMLNVISQPHLLKDSRQPLVQSKHMGGTMMQNIEYKALNAVYTCEGDVN